MDASIESTWAPLTIYYERLESVPLLNQETNLLFRCGNVMLSVMASMMNSRENQKEYGFIYYLPTGEIFNFSSVRIKSGALTIFTPLVSVIRSVYWFAKGIFMLITGKNGSEIFYDSMRALYYGALMTTCAFRGIFSSYDTWRRYGQLERTLNRHSDGPHRDKFYLGYCFQPITTLSKNNRETEERLRHYLERKRAIEAAFWSKNSRQLMKELKWIQ